MLLHVREAAHGLWCEVDTTEIARTSRLVSRMTGYQVQPNKAIVGRNAFAHESGIHQDGVLKERTTYEIMDATTIGLEQNQIVLGKHSGRHALRNALQELGFTGRRRRAEYRVQGVQGAGGQEEGGHRARPGGDRLRRDPPVGRRLRAGVVRGRGLLGAHPAGPRPGAAARRRDRRGQLHRGRPGGRLLQRAERRHRPRGPAARVPRERGHRRAGRAGRGLRADGARRAQHARAWASPRTSSRPRAAPTCARCRPRWPSRRADEAERRWRPTRPRRPDRASLSATASA